MESLFSCYEGNKPLVEYLIIHTSCDLSSFQKAAVVTEKFEKFSTDQSSSYFSR